MRYRNLEERLIANSVVCEETGCWVWTGAQDHKGYGYICIRVPVKHTKYSRRKRTVVWKKEPRGHRAHRVAYQVLKGVVLSDEQTVDHRCPMGPNKLCINPGHLGIETRANNTRLMWARRRAVSETGQPALF